MAKAGAYEVRMATDKQLDEFYDDWSLTIEGLSTKEESLNDYYEVLSDLTELKEGFIFYVVKGHQMNERYNLTGHNRYKDDLNIIVTPNTQFGDIGRVAIPRLMWGGRWFNDIVDNNAMREASA